MNALLLLFIGLLAGFFSGVVCAFCWILYKISIASSESYQTWLLDLQKIRKEIRGE